MTMMELQRTYHAVNEWQWTYPQFRQHIPRSAGHTERGFPVCLVLLDMPVDTGLWDVGELQLLGTGSQPMDQDEKGERITVHIVQRGDAIPVHFGYDRKRYFHETVVDLQEHFFCGTTGIVQWWHEPGCCNFSNEGPPGNTFRLVEDIDALT